MDSEKEREAEIVSVDQLPDDPLKMPPPYWRSSGAIFHITSALEDLELLLQELIPLNASTSLRLDAHYGKHPGRTSESDGALSEFGDICEPLWQIEHRIRLRSEVACLMSAILAEEILNQFCVFNLHRSIAEPIEKLAPVDKILVASAILGHFDVKGTLTYESLQKLGKWRNAFVHGHCVDRPTKSLRHNHLISPETYPGVKSALSDAVEMVGALFEVETYLSSISLNPYTQAGSAGFGDIEDLMSRLGKYKIEGDEYVFDIREGEADG